MARYPHAAQSILLIAALVLGLASAPNAAGASDLTRTHTETMIYSNPQDDPGRVLNMQIAFRRLQAFFDAVQFQRDVEYSFVNDVLHGSLAQSAGFVNGKAGYGDGVGAAASLLNALVHQTMFWASDGTQKTVFEEVEAKLIKNDRLIGAYSVLIYLDPGGLQSYDYVWRLNPAYTGPPPRIAVRFDTATQTITMTVTYADAIVTPAAVRSSKDGGLTDTLKRIIGDRRLGVTLIPVDNPQSEIDINENAQVPSASAWKGGGMIYFFEQVNPQVWSSVPIKYWNLQNVRRVPPEYQQAWLQYHEILRWVYVMTVFSGNHEAANVLAYVYENTPQEKASNAIMAFNDWSRQAAGIGPESGLYSWQYGHLMSPGYIDARFGSRYIDYGGNQLFYSSTISARDLALYYYHLATVGKQRGYYDKVVELLSIRTDIVSKIEGQVADHPEIQTATKDGYFSPTSENSLGHDVNDDAGLLIFPDGRRYAVGFTAFDAVDIESDVVGVVIRALLNNQIADMPPSK